MEQRAIYILFFSVLCMTVNAQSQILDNYILEALEQNLSIRSSQLAKEKQLSRIEQAKKLWGPTIDLNANYLLAAGGRKINFPLGDLFNPVNGAINEITGTNQFPTNLENAEFQLTPNNFIDAQLNANLPIINSSIRYNQQIQENLLEMEYLNLDLIKEDIALQVKSAYYNYLKSLEGLKIMDTSKELLNEVLTFNQKLVQFDKATEEIVYDVEFEIESLNSQRAKLEEQSTLAKALFNLLLNRDLTTEVEVDTEILQKLNYELLPVGDLQKTAMANRIEFEQLDVATRINSLNSLRIQKEGQPTLGVQGGIGIQTENFDFDLGGPLYTIGLGMKVNLFDNGLRKRKVEELQIEQHILNNNRAQLNQQVSIEILQAYYALASLNSQLVSEDSAVKSAQKSYDLTKVRYENDKAILIELLQAQNRLTTTQMSKALTQYDLLIKQAELEKTINTEGY